MLIATTIAGNIFCDGQLRARLGGAERIRVSRSDLAKSRIRRQTDAGTDVGLSLPAGGTLHHGDVITDGKEYIIVEQLAEKVMCVRPAGGAGMEQLVLLGHAIGNLHRPVSMDGGAVCFPIQADSERELFGRMFGKMEGLAMSIEEKVFCPHDMADVRGHG